MRQKKPAGWPPYMRAKKLKNGLEAYYWEAPTWAKAHPSNPIAIKSEPLGPDYATAKARCDDFLNPMLAEWNATKDMTPDQRTAHLVEARENVQRGSFRWLCLEFIRSRDFKKLKPESQKQYRTALDRLCHYRLAHDEAGRTFGQVMLSKIDAAAADKILDRISLKADGTPRPRKAYQSMQIARRAWNVGHRRWPAVVSENNPFAKTGMRKPTGGEARPATRDELAAFIAQADAMGFPAMALAAEMAWEFMIRSMDLIKNVAWSRYRSKDNPDAFEVVHNKNQDRPLIIPLQDRKGNALFADLEARITATPKRGTLMIMNDVKDARSGEFRPLSYDQFNRRANLIIRAAGLDGVSFSSFRKGGETECGDAGLTDTETMAIDGHKTRDMLTIYVARTKTQSMKGQKKRMMR